MGRREAALALVGFLAAAYLCLALPLAAQAERRASRGESQRMWDTVFAKYGFDGCVQHRGEISTAHTRRKYGVVTVSDSHCGNGQFVLSTRRHAAHARWRVLGAGSDWGAPERCAEDLRRIPRSVLEDLFSPEICRGRAAARKRMPANASEAGALIQPDGGGAPYLSKPPSFDWVSYGVSGTASEFHWRRWGRRVSVGVGATRFCITMNGGCHRLQRVKAVARRLRGGFTGPEGGKVFVYCDLKLVGRFDPRQPNRTVSLPLPQPEAVPCQGEARVGSPRERVGTAPYSHCRDVVIRNADGSVYTQSVGLARRSARCGLARRIARRVMRSDGEDIPSPLGFTCLRESGGFICSRGAQRVRWHL
jgi:hypothetical protein